MFFSHSVRSYRLCCLFATVFFFHFILLLLNWNPCIRSWWCYPNHVFFFSFLRTLKLLYMLHVIKSVHDLWMIVSCDGYSEQRPMNIEHWAVKVSSLLSSYQMCKTDFYCHFNTKTSLSFEFFFSNLLFALHQIRIAGSTDDMMILNVDNRFGFFSLFTVFVFYMMRFHFERDNTCTHQSKQMHFHRNNDLLL